MSASLTIALDAMGGDRAPQMVVAGANMARRRHPNLSFLLFGDEGHLKKLMPRFSRLARVCSVCPSESVVGPSEKPSVALRRGQRSSMRLAIDAVGNGEAKGVVSAGNTGALMAMAMLVLKTLPGITRPAIASLFPTRRGKTVMLDLGANVECDAENLVQFALMGEVFARSVLGVVKPTVGLLNVGIEETKGNEAVRAANELLRLGRVPISFYGFVEGDDIAKGTVDVVVTDGFTGNIALKTMEGTARLYTEFLRATFRRSIFSKLGYWIARPALRTLRNRVDPRRYNGGMLLGVNGVAVKSHGGTDALGFANAIGFAVDMVTEGFNDRVITEVNRWNAAEPTKAATL